MAERQDSKLRKRFAGGSYFHSQISIPITHQTTNANHHGRPRNGIRSLQRIHTRKVLLLSNKLIRSLLESLDKTELTGPLFRVYMSFIPS